MVHRHPVFYWMILSLLYSPVYQTLALCASFCKDLFLQSSNKSSCPVGWLVGFSVLHTLNDNNSMRGTCGDEICLGFSVSCRTEVGQRGFSAAQIWLCLTFYVVLELEGPMKQTLNSVNVNHSSRFHDTCSAPSLWVMWQLKVLVKVFFMRFILSFCPSQTGFSLCLQPQC